MSDWKMPALILGPILVAGLFLAIFSRADVELLKTDGRRTPHIFGILWAICSCLGGLVTAFLFLNNPFGAALLMIAGLVTAIQGKLFNDWKYVRGFGARLFGLAWLTGGVILAVRQFS